MKIIIPALIFIMPVTTHAQESFIKNEYKPLIDISLVGGLQHGRYVETSTAIYGLEVSLQCPLINPKKNSIRQQFSIIRQEGRKQKSFSLDVNPQYKLIANSTLELAAGPCAGLIFSNVTVNNRPIFNYGLGTSVAYQFKNFCIGLGRRYALTKKVLLDNINDKSETSMRGNLNNSRIFFKVGYKFY